MARKLYKTPVIRCRGFGFRERRAPRRHGGLLCPQASWAQTAHSPSARIRFYPWVLGLGSLAGLRTVLTWWLLAPQTAKVFSTSLSSCEFHGDAESPMHAIAHLWVQSAMSGKVVTRLLGAVSFKATKIIDKPISDKAR